jgi:serine/threonine protein kinase
MSFRGDYLCTSNKLGAGIFGVVWKGWALDDKGLAYPIAIKELKSRKGAMPPLKMIQREITMMRQLSCIVAELEHPNIVVSVFLSF